MCKTLQISHALKCQRADTVKSLITESHHSGNIITHVCVFLCYDINSTGVLRVLQKARPSHWCIWCNEFIILVRIILNIEHPSSYSTFQIYTLLHKQTTLHMHFWKIRCFLYVLISVPWLRALSAMSCCLLLTGLIDIVFEFPQVCFCWESTTCRVKFAFCHSVQFAVARMWNSLSKSRTLPIIVNL